MHYQAEVHPTSTKRSVPIVASDAILPVLSVQKDELQYSSRGLPVFGQNRKAVLLPGRRSVQSKPYEADHKADLRYMLHAWLYQCGSSSVYRQRRSLSTVDRYHFCQCGLPPTMQSLKKHGAKCQAADKTEIAVPCSMTPFETVSMSLVDMGLMYLDILSVPMRTTLE